MPDTENEYPPLKSKFLSLIFRDKSEVIKVFLN
jgi:hypothetical protein|nr:Hypothetical protein [Enterobacter cloacae]